MEKYIKNDEILYANEIVLTIEKNGKKYEVYNPSKELLIENGWEVYTQPIPEKKSKNDLYKEQVIKRIRKKYSIDDEIAIIRQRDTKPDEFEKYNAFVESCKAKARVKKYIKNV
jgi:hypothetical protein